MTLSRILSDLITEHAPWLVDPLNDFFSELTGSAATTFDQYASVVSPTPSLFSQVLAFVFVAISVVQGGDLSSAVRLVHVRSGCRQPATQLKTKVEDARLACAKAQCQTAI